MNRGKSAVFVLVALLAVGLFIAFGSAPDPRDEVLTITTEEAARVYEQASRSVPEANPVMDQMVADIIRCDQGGLPLDDLEGRYTDARGGDSRLRISGAVIYYTSPSERMDPPPYVPWEEQYCVVERLPGAGDGQVYRAVHTLGPDGSRGVRSAQLRITRHQDGITIWVVDLPDGEEQELGPFASTSR